MLTTLLDVDQSGPIDTVAMLFQVSQLPHPPATFILVRAVHLECIQLPFQLLVRHCVKLGAVTVRTGPLLLDYLLDAAVAELLPTAAHHIRFAEYLETD